MTQQNAAMVEESTAASRALVSETEELMRLIGQFQVGRVASGSSVVLASPPAAATGRIVTALRASGRGGAARKSQPAEAADDWKEF